MMIMTPAASTLIPVTVAISGISSVMSACVAFVVSAIIVVNALISVVEPIGTTSQHCTQHIYLWLMLLQ